jgi:inosine/xanthosine triphosphate pyrophosphatase family protein
MEEGRLRRAAFGALTEAENEQEEPKVPPVTLFLRFEVDGALVTSARRKGGFGGKPWFSSESFTGLRAAEWQPEPKASAAL